MRFQVTRKIRIIFSLLQPSRLPDLCKKVPRFIAAVRSSGLGAAVKKAKLYASSQFDFLHSTPENCNWTSARRYIGNLFTKKILTSATSLRTSRLWRFICRSSTHFRKTTCGGAKALPNGPTPEKLCRSTPVIINRGNRMMISFIMTCPITAHCSVRLT